MNSIFPPIFPTGPTAAGIICAGAYMKIYEPLMRVLKKLAASSYKKASSLRLRAKKKFLIAYIRDQNLNNQLPPNVLRSNRNFYTAPHQSQNLNVQLTAFGPLNENEINEDEERVRSVFTICNVNVNVKFSYALCFWNQRSVLKVAEGSYAEIYSFKHVDGSQRIFKCMPVNGKHPLKRSPNIPLYMAVPDMVSSTSLSSLNENPCFLAPNFPTVHRISVIKDKFPERLMRSWWSYKMDPHRWQDPAEHPQPDLYDETQRFLTIETSFCGTPLPLKLQKLQNTWIGLSIMSQVVSALAVAEEAFEFEHRDLHLGNILIHETEVVALNYTIQNLNFSVQTVGHRLFIIDFTLSRINKDGKVYCVELDQLSERAAEDDGENTWLNHQNLYGMMSEYFHGNWRQFIPKTNVIWLKYLNENIMESLRKNNPNLHQLVAEPGEYDQMAAMRLLKRWNDCLLNYDSAKNFLLDVLLNNNRLVEVINEQQ